MKSTTLSLLECSSCRLGFRCHVLEGNDAVVHSGWLECPSCGLSVPILRGFVDFNQAAPHGGLFGLDALHKLADELMGSPTDFEAAWQTRRNRGAMEAYAAFHPFNESTRALEPLLPTIAATLRPGDAIVDLWCRTGWAAEWLAGLFPDQQVIALWEGAYSVLGYKGYAHLLGENQRAPNLDVIFTTPQRPLPLRSAAFGFVYSHDALHRLPWFPFAGESLRVTRQGGATVHAHVHLCNAQPEPYFDRGGRILHGRDYQQWLDRLPNHRLGLVLGETDLVEATLPWPPASDPDTACYNALLAVLPASPPWILPPTPAETPPDSQRWLRHPMFELDLARSRIRPGAQALERGFRELLPRHPSHAACLPGHPIALDDTALLAGVLAAGGLTAAEIRAAFEDDGGASALSSLTALTAQHVMLAVTVGPAALRLQEFHALSPDPLGTWQGLGAASHIQLPDGQILKTEDLALLKTLLCSVIPTSPDAGCGRVALLGTDEPLILVLAALAATLGHDVLLTDRLSDVADRYTTVMASDHFPDQDGRPLLRLGLDGAPNSLLASSPQCGDADRTRLPAAAAAAAAHASLAIVVAGQSVQFPTRALLQGLRSFAGSPAGSPLFLDATHGLRMLLRVMHHCAA